MLYMRYLFLASFCAMLSMSLVQSSPSYAEKANDQYRGDALFSEGSLCAADEVILSNCEMLRKSASLCGVKNSNNEIAGLQYRVGSKEKLEFSFPLSLAGSLEQFQLSKLGASGAETHVTFENDGYEYIIFGKNPLGERSSYGIAVRHKSKIIAINQCTKGRPAIFQQAYRILKRGPYSGLR